MPVFEVLKQVYQYPCSRRHTERPKTLFETTSPRSVSYQSWNTRFCFVRVSELCTLFIVTLRRRGLSFYHKVAWDLQMSVLTFFEVCQGTSACAASIGVEASNVARVSMLLSLLFVLVEGGCTAVELSGKD